MIFPSTLAYGPVGEYTSGGKVKIPPYETLLFDVEILSVEAVIEEDPAAPEQQDCDLQQAKELFSQKKYDRPFMKGRFFILPGCHAPCKNKLTFECDISSYAQ